MKKKRVLFEQTKFVSTILNVVVASAVSITLPGCAAEHPDTQPTETPMAIDLTGNWKEVEPDEKQWYEAVIDDKSITVFQIDSKNERTIWNGTYSSPESGDTWEWISESFDDEDLKKESDSEKTKVTADTKAKENDSESDSSETMNFSYSDGILSFEVELDKEAKTVEMEKVVLLDYSSAEEFEIKDKEGKVTGKYSVLTVKKADVTNDALEDWYNSYVAEGNYKYAVIVFVDEEGKGIYADSKNVYVNTDLSEAKDGGYTEPESDPTYAVDDGKLDVTEKELNKDTEEESGDKDSSKNEEKKTSNNKDSASTSSNKESSSNKDSSKASGSSNTGSSTGTKPSGNTSSSKPSTNTGGSSSGNQSTNTKPTDPNAGKTKVWVVDTPAWDETVVVTPAWTEEKVVVDTPAWDETVVVQEGYSVTICNVCQAQFTGPNQITDVGVHAITTHGGGGYHTDTVPPVTQVVHHEAVTHVEYIHHEAVTQVIHHDEVGHWEWR